MMLLFPLVKAWAIPFVFAGWALVIIARFRTKGFRCPRCGELFGVRDFGLFSDTRPAFFNISCLHCGIAMGTSKTLSDIRDTNRLGPEASASAGANGKREEKPELLDEQGNGANADDLAASDDQRENRKAI
jgi:hypothetical protein